MSLGGGLGGGFMIFSKIEFLEGGVEEWGEECVGEGGGEIGERKIVAGKKGEYLTDTNQLTSIMRAGIPRQLLFITIDRSIRENKNIYQDTYDM